MTECNIDTCKAEIKLDNHHIQSKCYGGSNALQNRAKICPNCHRKVHQGELIIEGWFQTSTGKVLIHRKKGEQSITGLPDPRVWLYTDKAQGNRGDKVVQKTGGKGTD